MAGLNKVLLIGRIGKDPDIFNFDNGGKKLSFPLATTESYRDRNSNEWIEQTEWHNIVGYRYLADKDFSKGDLVYVEGKIKTRKYQDKDGNDRYVTEIIADKINILMKVGAGQGQGSYQSSNNQPSASSQPSDAVQDLPDAPEDDLPF